jgi:hypothetical protein
MCAPVSELYEHAVSGRLDEPAVMLGKCGIDDLASAMGLRRHRDGQAADHRHIDGGTGNRTLRDIAEISGKVHAARKLAAVPD